jgi:hypothetical protein
MFNNTSGARNKITLDLFYVHLCMFPRNPVSSLFVEIVKIVVRKERMMEQNIIIILPSLYGYEP